MSQDDMGLFNAFHTVAVQPYPQQRQEDCFDFVLALQTPAGRQHAIDLLQAYVSMLQPAERVLVLQAFCPYCGAWQHGHVCQHPDAPTWQEMGTWPY